MNERVMRYGIPNDVMTISYATTNTSKTNGVSATIVGTPFIYTLALEKYKNQYIFETVKQILQLYYLANGSKNSKNQHGQLLVLKRSKELTSM